MRSPCGETSGRLPSLSAVRALRWPAQEMGPMTWLQRYRARHYVGNSIWIWSSLSVAAAVVGVHLLRWIEEGAGWESALPPSTAQVVLGAMASSMFTFIVFVCSALLVAVQLASSQLTPRIIALVFRSPVMRISMSLFVFNFTFCTATLIRITEFVPALTVYVAAYGSIVSLAV